MKILLAHYKYYVQGGPERYMLKFTELAEKNGHKVVPFAVRYDRNIENKYSRYFPNGSNSSGMYDPNDKNLGYLLRGAYLEFHNRDARKKLKKLIDDENPDVLYCLIPGELTPDIFKIAKKKGVPCILRLSDFRLLCGKMNLLRGENICEECIHGKYLCMVKHKCVKDSALVSCLRMLSLYYSKICNRYKYVDAVIAPPRFTAKKFIEASFFPEEKVFINPTFIDCSQIEVSSVFKPYVLCLGRFTLEKGFIYVVEAMKHLQDIPVTVAVTGDRNGCSPELEALIEKYNLEDKITFVGFLHGEALEKIINESLCVACPAIWYENMPNTVLEAYAYGKPVIASNIGSLAEIVEDGVTGLLFDPKNSKQIADCIRKLYEDPELCMRLGKQGRKMCETVYSPQRHWKNFMSIYEEIKKEK